MPITRIRFSAKYPDGVYVKFDGWGYYAHNIKKVGAPDDAPGNLISMWGWINHLREKNWWNAEIEEDFKKKVMRFF